MEPKSQDISHILRDWEHHPDEMNVRRIMGSDGKEKIQMRLDLGLLQMETEGRPDGKRPHGYESLLEFHLDSLRRHKEQKETDEGWRITAEEATQLRQEGLQYYHRYLSFFVLEDWPGVMRDTERNLRSFDLLWNYGPEDERWSSEQYRPYVVMMNTRARVSLALQDREYDLAIRQLEGGIATIEGFFQRHNRPDLAQESSELQFLNEWLQKVKERRPLTQRQRLQRALENAVREEEYERAAEIRDALRDLISQEEGAPPPAAGGE